MHSLDTRKEAAHRAIKRLKGKITQQDIAQNSGVAYGALKNFSWKQLITDEDFERLEKWLTERGFLEETAASAQEAGTVYGGSRVSSLVVCPECRQETPQDFDGKTLLCCGHCGAHIFIECPNPKCGIANPYHADFCKRCNTALSDAAAHAANMAEEAVGTALLTPIQRLRKREKQETKRGVPKF